MVSEDVQQRVVSYIKHQASKSPEAIADLVAVGQAKYLALAGAVSEEVASRKPAPDEWSLRELMRHVVAAETSVAALIASSSRGEQAPAREPRRGIGMMDADAGEPYSSLVAHLRQVNETMLQAIRDVPASPDLSVTPPHPFFGPLNCWEWAAFQRIHDEDHVQHAAKILAAVGDE